MATVRNERLYKDEPLLIPGLSQFHHWGNARLDEGTVHKSDRRSRKGYKHDNIGDYKRSCKRKSRHRNR